jgi:hypothetical protein
MHDEGDAELVEQGDAAVVRARRRDIDRVDLLVGDDAAIGRLLVQGIRRAQHQVELVAAGIVAEARQELDEMRIDVDRCPRRHDIADHPGLAGRQPARARVRPVAVALGGIGDPAARLFADLRIAVQRAAHRGLRQRQHVG